MCKSGVSYYIVVLVLFNKPIFLYVHHYAQPIRSFKNSNETIISSPPACRQKVDKSGKKQSLSPYLHTLCSNTFFIFDNSTVPNRQINGA